MDKTMKKQIEIENWKKTNERYLFELQKFLDRADNIGDEQLKESVIKQMLICDDILTQMSEEMFKRYYEKGLKEANKV